MANCVRDFAYWMHEWTGQFIAFAPGRDMQFVPQVVSDYLCEHIPSPSIGAINQYVWTAAFAREESVMVQAIRNLLGLLPVDFLPDTLMDEA